MPGARTIATLGLAGLLALNVAPAVTPLALAQTGEDTSQTPIPLINQRSITPAGRQTELGDLPLHAILSPDGGRLLVANSGAGTQSVQVIDPTSGRIVQTLPYNAPDSVFIGLAYSPDGKRAYAAGGGSAVVHAYTVGADGALTPDGDITIGTVKDNPYPTGLSISPDGATLYVANNRVNTVSVVDTASKTVSGTIKVGGYPYTPLVSRDGSRVYVSNWGDASVSIIDAHSNTVTATVSVGDHPSAMVLGFDDLVYVADANSDAVSIVDGDDAREVRRIAVKPYTDAPLSASPQGLSTSPDGHTVYVADAGHNDVAIIGPDAEGIPSGVIGRLPTAWYPTDAVVSRDGRTLFVTNAKGVGAGRNDTGFYPNPTRQTVPFQNAIEGYAEGGCQCTFDRFSGTMILGTLSTIDIPDRQSGRLALYTAQVARNNRDQATDVTERSANNPIPAPGNPSPIKHVIYVIKENRTYDQVFGDEAFGNGDPDLVLFGRGITPNLHALAERFGLLDNFYADAEVSADGHNWSLSANASDYNEKMWPQNYSAGKGRNRSYDFEGGSSINLSPGGYLWDAAAEAGITYRNYGEYYQFDANYPVSKARLIAESDAPSCDGPVAHWYVGMTVPAGQVLCFLPMNINPTTTPNLVGHIDPRFRAYDMRYREADRLSEWAREFDMFVANGDLPQLEIVRLPNDHTSGTTPGHLTPQSMVAENDFAVGKLVERVSTSPYWASTAIFITEDDAQNGPDHVDAHRTTSLVVSPYTSQAHPRAEHTLYDTAAMLRTMELIVGLRPLSQFDADANPMWHLFSGVPDLTPYTAEPNRVGYTTNSPTAYGADVSAQMDFSVEDRVPMDVLNAVLWHAIKGADVPYPGAATSLANDLDD